MPNIEVQESISSIKCERCGDYLNHDDGFVLKSNGYDFNLCDRCNSIYEFDKKTKNKI